MRDVTLLLRAVELGEEQSAEDLLPVIYEELRHLAAARMAHEAAGHTLQPTALVHEAWLRLVNEEDRTWPSRAYFFAAAAEAMRRILVEHARRKGRLKHGGGQQRLNVEDLNLAAAAPDEKILLINEALEHLEAEHPQQARIVVLKYFSGLSNKEVAQALGLSERSVDRHWVFAKVWLYRKIQQHQ